MLLSRDSTKDLIGGRYRTYSLRRRETSWHRQARAVAQAVGRRLLIQESRIRSQAVSCEIFGGRSGSGTMLQPVSIILTALLNHHFSHHRCCVIFFSSLRF